MPYLKLQNNFDEDGSEKESGVGMGLNICKQIVEQSGGSIDVSSEGVGLGTTIAFSMKMNPSEAKRNRLRSRDAISEELYFADDYDEFSLRNLPAQGNNQQRETRSPDVTNNTPDKDKAVCTGEVKVEIEEEFSQESFIRESQMISKVLSARREQQPDQQPIFVLNNSSTKFFGQLEDSKSDDEIMVAIDPNQDQTPRMDESDIIIERSREESYLISPEDAKDEDPNNLEEFK